MFPPKGVKNMYSSNIPNSQKPETVQMFINSRMDKISHTTPRNNAKGKSQTLRASRRLHSHEVQAQPHEGDVTAWTVVPLRGKY